MVKVIVQLGGEDVRDANPDCKQSHEFATTAEAKAFIDGAHEAEGWDEVSCEIVGEDGGPEEVVKAIRELYIATVRSARREEGNDTNSLEQAASAVLKRITGRDASRSEINGMVG